MDYIYKEQVLNIYIDVYKGQSAIKEDFSRADLKVFLVCGVEKLRIPLSVTLDSTGTLKGSVSNLPIGIYGIKLMWNKNHGRSPMIAEKYQLFGITEYLDEATNSAADSVNIKTVLRSATYGYDGLDAYELSVMRGKTILDEDAWLDMINKGGGEETSVTYSEWELSFNLAKTVADPDGDLIKVESASISRVKTTKVNGQIVSQIPETRNASLDIVNGTKQVTEGVTYIKVSANESEQNKTVLVKAYDTDLRLSKTITVTQSPATSIYIINAKEASGYVVEYTTREVVIDDNAVTIYFKKYGSIGTPVVSGAPSWLTVSPFTISGSEIKFTVTPTANTTENERIATLKVTINGNKEVPIKIMQSCITSEDSEFTVSLSYDDIDASGSTVSANKSAKVTTSYERSSGRTYDVVNNNPTVEYSFSDNKGLVNESTGDITYMDSSKSTNREPLVYVTMTAETEGFNPVQKSVQVYQAGAKLYAYWGGGANLPTTGDTTNKKELDNSGANIGEKSISGRYKWIAVPDGYTPKLVNVSPETEITLTKQTTPVSFANINCYIYYFDSRLATTVNYKITVTK